MTTTVTIPTLKTDRLTLRAPHPDDLAANADFYMSDRSTFIGGPFDLPAVGNILIAQHGLWSLHGYGWWSIDDASGCVGTCGFHLHKNTSDIEFGMVMFSGTGQGYATEAGITALDWGRARFDRIVGYVKVNNIASRKLTAAIGATDTGERVAHDQESTVWLHRQRVSA